MNNEMQRFIVCQMAGGEPVKKILPMHRSNKGYFKTAEGAEEEALKLAGLYNINTFVLPVFQGCDIYAKGGIIAVNNKHIALKEIRK